ncbi:NO-inducible flavohemoprotein [Stenotrophomonas sp. ATCM1_4]|uniref:nitric oxide dioxygenase n=1 Tax=Stenotrophomonas capsici TaxID=3110230 RepID=A0ABU5UYN8_9GAMM|nr:MULTISPECIES: NO-inducible flavohemoprotein [unclassified Stenotrophomonas]MBD9535918.1 NO-inducible flavohemoprotein [Stenotrophomonas sp. STM01]MEA5666205.1 NO-inducible flavohemoprotein [Stenotrophomonas sp. MH1]TDB27451.1 NO-inducible flavohemoprotein [Stenotrophomonas sp. ATCM1_4]
MLTAAQRDLIKATVPLLETGGEALTKHFYGLMLTESDAARPLFNQAHQSSGDQPRALANSVLMYAKHIDRLEALGPLVGQIVAKHVALQVLPEHYPIVGHYLLRSIREVLGPEIATDEIIDAWGTAYQMLADLLIGAEESVYAANEQAPGGWRGGRMFQVVDKVRESAEITSFHLQPVDGGAVVDFQPGQYIGMRLQIDGQEVRRNYSLSAVPNGRSYRISVKREDGGKVSNHLHDNVQLGDALELFAPAGDFTLVAGDRPIALISGGVGITPTLPMLEQALASGRPVHFIHCARNGQVHAFRQFIADMQKQHPQLRSYTCYSEALPGDAADAEGLLSRELLQQWLPAEGNVDAYFLGPKPFMAQVKKLLRDVGVPDAQSRYEFFGPAAALEA